jgi:hypothetical protein
MNNNGRLPFRLELGNGNEFRHYTKECQSLVTSVPLLHDRVALEFSVEKFDGINRKVQPGEWSSLIL